MEKTSIIGFPRIGENRELKRSLEDYWSKKITLSDLQNTASRIRKKHIQLQKDNGIEFVSCNDFSLYDNMLDTIIMLGAEPERFLGIEDVNERYFSMARGVENIQAMAMTKWFNTNYHYIVPELFDKINFKLNSNKIISEYKEAKQIIKTPKINIIGPLTFLKLSRTTYGNDPLQYLNEILPVYEELFKEISALDDKIFVQMEEPVFAMDTDADTLNLLRQTYKKLSLCSDNINIIFTTYFEHSVEAVKALEDIDIWAFALDFAHGLKNLDALKFVGQKKLFAGVVNGRNIWKNDIDQTIKLLDNIKGFVEKENIIISSSCSLLHVPYTIENEPDSVVKNWMSYASEKIKEVNLIANLFHSTASQKDLYLADDIRKSINERSKSSLVHNEKIQQDIKNIKKFEREGSFEGRIESQKSSLNYGVLPTTTIGSFPQTKELRALRSDFRKNIVSKGVYNEGIKKYISDCIKFQEEAGLDVLVHGEPERTDMVEYFGEKMEGFHFTKNAWVQSYGSRCVKPPVIYGDICRPAKMTVEWITYAQSLTDKIVKGMLTGPVTILNWSFVRDDIERFEVSRQIAVALGNEIDDLQKSGIKIIQVDEAAFKEGYPLRKENIKIYEKWAVEDFKLAISKAEKDTQIHTHMCYSDFSKIMDTIEEMDADVITIETARSGNVLLQIFKEHGYKNEIGPGVYDIHSPRVPTVDEFVDQIKSRLEVLPASQLWINPDCGLKTRKWDEVKPALMNMVKAVKIVKDSI